MAMRRCVWCAIALLPGSLLAQPAALVVTADPNDPSRFVCDTKFATFKVPKGWSANRSDKNSLAILTRVGETPPNVTSMISIDFGKPVAPGAKATAEAFAKKWRGVVSGTAVRLDGETGYRVAATANGRTVTPIDCIVASKGDNVFLLIGGAKSNDGLDKALDDLAASWKWKK